MKPSRRLLFISMLALSGLLAGSAVSALLIASRTVRFGWTDRLLREHENSKARGKDRRVLVLGDSYLVEWSPLPDCLYYALRGYAREHDLGLMNCAVGGFGPLEYLDQLEQHGPEFKPQLVLLFYFAGNDLTGVQWDTDGLPVRIEDWRPAITWPRGPTPTPHPSRSPVPPPQGHLPDTVQDPQHPIDWAAARAKGIPEAMLDKVKRRLLDRDAFAPGEFITPYMIDLALRGPRFLLDNLLIDSGENLRAWEVIEEKFTLLKRRCDELGARLCIVCLPASPQVDRSHFDFYRALTMEIDDRLLHSTRPQDLLRGFCSRNKADFVDPLPDFRARPRPPFTYYIEDDDHFANEGHRLAFEVLRRDFLDAWTAGSHAPGPLPQSEKQPPPSTRKDAQPGAEHSNE